MISQRIEIVGASVNGSRIAVSACGTSSMSLSEMPCQPRIDEPSKPRPSSKALSSKAESGSDMCCHDPSRSVNFRSTIFACVAAPELERLGGAVCRVGAVRQVVLLFAGHSVPPAGLDQ